MALPTEIDFMLLKMGDGAATEVFTLICGIQNVDVNFGANTQDRFVRDCAKPGEVPVRKVKTTGRQLDVTGEGLTDVDNLEDVQAALGQKKNYRIEAYADDGTDAGTLLGTFAGEFVLTSNNLSAPRDGVSSGNVALANNGPWTYTPAP